MFEASEDGAGESPLISAGMTFLGQFIDHDLTLDTISKIGVAISMDYPLENFRTPRLDLDSVYGKGPAVNWTCRVLIPRPYLI